MMIAVGGLWLALGAAGATAQDADSRRRDFEFLWGRLRDQYPFFELKGVDWEAVRRELAPRVDGCADDREFVRLCAEMVGRLRDGHASIESPTVPSEEIFDRDYNPGVWFAQVRGGGVAVVAIDPESSAAQAGVVLGSRLRSVDGVPAERALAEAAAAAWARGWVSSERRARYGACYRLLNGPQGSVVDVEIEPDARRFRRVSLERTLASGGYPATFLPFAEFERNADVYHVLRPDGVGHIYIRRFSGSDGGKAAIEAALAEMAGARGYIIDVRRNGGGGVPQVEWPRDKPVALLMDAGTLSAGEGFAAYFEHPRSRSFGQATAGSSSAKTTVTVPSGLVTVTFSSRGRRGPRGMIEFYGVTPDEEVLLDAADLRAGRDTGVERAARFVLGGR